MDGVQREQHSAWDDVVSAAQQATMIAFYFGSVAWPAFNLKTHPCTYALLRIPRHRYRRPQTPLVTLIPAHCVLLCKAPLRNAGEAGGWCVGRPAKKGARDEVCASMPRNPVPTAHLAKQPSHQEITKAAPTPQGAGSRQTRPQPQREEFIIASGIQGADGILRRLLGADARRVAVRSLLPALSTGFISSPIPADVGLLFSSASTERKRRS